MTTVLPPPVGPTIMVVCRVSMVSYICTTLSACKTAAAQSHIKSVILPYSQLSQTVSDVLSTESMQVARPEMAMEFLWPGAAAACICCWSAPPPLRRWSWGSARAGSRARGTSPWWGPGRAARLQTRTWASSCRAARASAPRPAGNMRDPPAIWINWVLTQTCQFARHELHMFGKSWTSPEAACRSCCSANQFIILK